MIPIWMITRSVFEAAEADRERGRKREERKRSVVDGHHQALPIECLWGIEIWRRGGGGTRFFSVVLLLPNYLLAHLFR